MANKDNTQPGTATSIPAPSNVTAPMFALVRTVLDEIDRESERWIDYGLSQTREAAEVARTLRHQSVGITRTMLGQVEQTTSSFVDAAQSFAKPFLKVGV